MELLLIRHGQSEADLLNVHEGRADFSLTQLGKNQAYKLSQYVLKNYPPEVIITSPLRRALGTAEVLQKAIKCQLVIEGDLMEYNNGVLAGLARDEATRKFPLPSGGRPKHIPIEGGESEIEFRFRAEKVASQLLHTFKEMERIAVVSHGGMISNIIKSILGLPVQTQVSFPTGDTGIHLLQIDEKHRIFRFLNKQEHLNM